MTACAFDRNTRVTRRVITSLAVVVGALGVIAGFPLADPLVGLLITIAILVVLRGAARDIYRRLMDAVDPALTEQATATVSSTPSVVGIEHVRPLDRAPHHR